jgi:hypothetical protein
MIANITTIMYILSVFDESINNGNLQKSTAISRTDDENTEFNSPTKWTI